MSKIIELRTIIDALVDDISGGKRPSDARLIVKLKAVKELSYRRTTIRRAPPQSQPMTPELAVQIRAFAQRNKDMSFQDIANRFRVNSGRVSEALE
jgi:hypothetical protein